MRRLFVFASAFAFLSTAMAEPPTKRVESEKTTIKTESEKTTIKTETRVVASDANLLSNLWSMEDATPVPAGSVDLRLSYQWVTASSPANGGDSDDDSILSPNIWWGIAENWELTFNTPLWVGDGGDRPGGLDGNGDTYVGLLWRFGQQDDCWPAMALKTTVRIPTGDASEGIDGELRLILTNEYDSGVRSHLNGFLITANGDNDVSGPLAGPRDEDILVLLGRADPVQDRRDFQWGIVLGLDGPLCDDGSTRWVIDYMHRSSVHYGSGDMNILDAGLQWRLDECRMLGISAQVGLDDNEDTPNAGASVTYSYSLNF